MEALGTAFEERLGEIRAYLAFLDGIEVEARSGPPRLGAAGALITAQQQRILYSSVFLQLYNLVEATVVKCLDGVTDAALSGGNWLPGDLTEGLRREWVRVVARTHVELNPEHRLESALALCQHLVGALPVSGFKVEKGGGGNWDDDAIKQIAGRLGFNLQVSAETYSAIKRPFRDDLGPLQLIKKLRNSLAHGNVSFAECGENLTVGELRDLVDRTTVYLREVVGAFRSYIDGHQFVVQAKRPAVVSA
jgi:MAE_28990/MAE_18760-like HEPN